MRKKLASFDIDKVKKAKWKYVERKDIDALIEDEKDVQKQLILKLLYTSAIRNSELCNLKIEDLQLDYYYNEFGSLVADGKGGRPRYFYLRKDL